MLATQTDSLEIGSALSASMSRAYLVSLHILGDPARAEALVIEALDGLDPELVTSNSIRKAVVARLVSARLSGF